MSPVSPAIADPNESEKPDVSKSIIDPVEPVATDPSEAPSDVLQVTTQTPSASVTAPPVTTPMTVASDTIPNADASNATTARPPIKAKKKKSIATGSGSSQSGLPGGQGENTGRWTAEEHRLFLQGLEQHGKGWKKIASLIKSRTVVQIRTHAQKYFQKLSKARQNGDEGDVAMEGRGAGMSVTSGTTSAAAQTNKRRRQLTGTKRKAIQSVVSSAIRQGKKMAAEQAAAGVPDPIPPLPAVSPALAHFVLPIMTKTGCSSSMNTSQGIISGPELEDSLFRFLTPCPVEPQELQVNGVARQAGANPITLPSSNPSTAPSIGSGEVSPTGVQDFSVYSSWVDSKEPPSWYSKGADVEELLDVADTLDWLTDSGEINEAYHPPIVESADTPDLDTFALKDTSIGNSMANKSLSVVSLPCVGSNMDTVVPPLPSLFGGPGDGCDQSSKDDLVGGLHTSPSETDMAHLQVFDTPMEEHDFVSTILEESTDNVDNLHDLD